MEQAGVVILNDESIETKCGSEAIRLMGVNDPDFTAQGDVYLGEAHVMDAKLKAMLTEDSIYMVLLSHRPELFNVYAYNNINLILSGHATRRSSPGSIHWWPCGS